jgi:hypothetical protein
MKDSLDHSPRQAIAIKHELCSEKCDTCFKNRGCIYDQYLSAAILNMETPPLQSSMNNTAQQAVKEHNIIANAAAA